MSNSSTSDVQLRDRLRRVANSQLDIDIIRGTLLTVAVACLLMLVATVAEAFLWMPPLVRLMSLTTVTVGILLVAARYFFYPLLRRVGWYQPATAQEGAHLIGSTFPGASSRALTLLDLQDGRRSHTPPDLLEEATAQLSREVAPTTFEDAISRKPVRVSFNVAAGPVILLIVSFLAFPSSLQQASERLLSPGTTYSPPTPFSISMHPGNTELARGQSVSLTAAVEGSKIPDALSFEFRAEGGETIASQPAQYQGNGTFVLERDRVHEGFHYRGRADGVQTEWYRAKVVQHPVISDFQVQITPPPYTGEPTQQLPHGVGNIRALPESHVQIDLSTDGSPPEYGYIVFDEGDSLSLTIHPEGATGSFTMRHEGHYAIHLIDAEGRSNGQPIKYEMHLVEDLHPRVSLITPGPTEGLAGAQTALLRARIQDDYGFSQLRLFFRDEESGDFESIELPLDNPYERNQLIAYPWRLQADTGLSLDPGEAIEYFIQVSDNDRPGGYKSARSEIHRLYAPSEEDLVATQDQQRRSSDQMAGGFTEQQTLQPATDDPQSERQRTTGRNGYETDMGDIGQQHRDLAQQTEELSRDIESTLRDMERPPNIEEESEELIDHLREMSEELGIDDLSEALRQMQESMQQAPDNAQDAMKQLQRQDQSFQDRMEQMKSMLEQLKTRRELDALSDEAGQLASQQEELAESTREASQQENLTDTARDEMAAAQKAVVDAAEQLQERMRKSHQEMEDVRGAPRGAMQEQIDQMQEQDFPSQMQDASDAVRAGELDQAETSQSDMAQFFRNMQDQFGQMQQQMTQQQEQLNIAAIRQAIRNTLALSEQQERLMEPARNLTRGSDEQRERTARQHRLHEGLGVVSDTLRTLVRSVPTVSRRVIDESEMASTAMQEAIDLLSGRSPSQATRAQREALSGLNTLAFTLTRLLEHIQEGDSGGGSSMEQMAQQLQQMSGEQGQMNEEIQQMLNEMQGDRLSSDQEERVEQLAQQHQRLREELQQRREVGAGEGDADIDRLEEAADELEEVIADLRRDRLSRENQQEILMRLLETRRAMRNQDQRPERQAEVAHGTYPREQNPVELRDLEAQERLYQDILRARAGRYLPSYEALIQRYFQKISSSQ